MIYNDPSYKSTSKNDYKATGAIGLRNGAYWVIWAEAMQCTTSQMILNNYTILQKLIEYGYEGSVTHWFENAGMPDDFDEAVNNHARATGWVCPFAYDSRQKGDKFSRIEAVLVPLNDQGKLYFNEEMKSYRIGSLIAQQFGNFKSKMLPTEHDGARQTSGSSIEVRTVLRRSRTETRHQSILSFVFFGDRIVIQVQLDRIKVIIDINTDIPQP